jgi:hypothetical protein
MFFNRNERKASKAPSRLRFAACEFDASTRQLRVHGQVGNWNPSRSRRSSSSCCSTQARLSQKTNCWNRSGRG